MDKTEIFKSAKYRWVYTPVDNSLINEVSSWDKDISRPAAEIIAKRGINTKQEYDSFFNMPLNALLNPFSMLNMEKAAERVANAVINKEKICIYGDYDVDGITSTALLYLFLKKLDADVMYYIPNRQEEGYGLNNDAILDIASCNVNLLITVDCGISAESEVALAVSCNMDVIVTDHHQPSEILPLKALAIVNPMQKNDSYPFKYLAGVGVAFKLIMALRYVLRKRNFFSKVAMPNIKNLLDIVTLGTIADVVPLTGENRIFVRHGLEMMSGDNVRIGLDALKTVSGIGIDDILHTSHVGFLLAPRINAAGRIGSSDNSFNLLITKDRRKARKLAEELDNENKFRQTIERDIVKETFKKIDSEGLAEKLKGIVLYSKDWHPGVIGIVASRIVDKYFRPTVILTEDGGVYKGSARSIPHFHLFKGLQSVGDTLLSFGGHKYAAGLKAAPEKLSEFCRRFDEEVRKTLTEEDFIPEINIDAFLSEKDINPSFTKWLSKLEPFGTGNSEPIFAIRNVNKYQPPFFVGKENTHLKCYFERNGKIFETIGFNMKDYDSLISGDGPFDILFTITLNKWRGQGSVQLCLKDIRKSGG